MLTREQFTALAKRHMDMVFRVAFACLKSREDADDVVQNTLLALYRAKKPFQSEEHVKAWLVRVAVNECKKILRSPWRRRSDAPIEDFADTLAFEDPRDGELFSAIMGLEEKYRAVIVLYYYEGWSLAETAKLLGIPAATAGTRLARARQKLKRYLTEAECYE